MTASLLDRVPVIPVVVIDNLDHAVPIARALVKGGVPVIELTLRTPVALDAIERIAAAAKANGKPWGALSRTEEFALKCRELGCQLFSIAGDLDYINRGIAATKSAFPNFFS